MAYNDRVTIYDYVETEDILGSVKREKIPKDIPCRKTALSHEQQIGLFGRYDMSKFKLHVQGHYDDLEEVTYNGETKRVVSLIHHKNATVIVV